MDILAIATYYLFEWQASAVQVPSGIVYRPNERERPKFTPGNWRETTQQC